VDNKQYNKKGQDAADAEKIFAKVVEGTRQKVYYVLTYNNLLYDPLGPDSNRESRINTELKKTNKQTFDYYMHYLKDKNRMYITRAQRSFING